MSLQRGFVGEALTVTAFVSGAISALWSRALIAPFFTSIVGSTLVANGLALTVVFLCVYFAVSFATASLRKNVRTTQIISRIDRLLGAVFGIVRALFIIGIIVIVLNNSTSDEKPSWLIHAKIYPLANAIADLLQRLAPDESWVADRYTTPEVERDPIGDLIEKNN